MGKPKPTPGHPGLSWPQHSTTIESLADLERRDEALDAIEEATGIYRKLAEVRPDAFTPNLAMTLSNQSDRLADLGRREALEVIEEATGIYRELAQVRSSVFERKLAESLDALAARLAALGRDSQACEARTEATHIRGQL